MKTIKNLKNSLKFKAAAKSGLLTVRVGQKKYALPVEARMVQNGEYMFLSFSACSEIFHVKGKELVAMAPEADATDAHAALGAVRRRKTRRARQDGALPADLEQMIKNLPAGTRLGYGPDGQPRLVKTRTRRAK